MSERTSVQDPVIEDQRNAQKTEWTDAQKTAIGSEIKLILVSAAAGSGKTAVLAERVIRRILDPKYNLKLSDLLIVTFTRAAAAELKISERTLYRKIEKYGL